MGLGWGGGLMTAQYFRIIKYNDLLLEKKYCFNGDFIKDA